MKDIGSCIQVVIRNYAKFLGITNNTNVYYIRRNIAFLLSILSHM